VRFLPTSGYMPVWTLDDDREFPEAIHSHRSTSTTAPLLEIVLDDDPVPTHMKARVQHLQRFDSDGAIGMKGRPRLHDPPKFSTLHGQTQNIYDYCTLASREHAYWFCVYYDAMSATDLQTNIDSPDCETYSMAKTELSQDDLLTAEQLITGLEIIEDHQHGSVTRGCVVDACTGNGGRSLFVLIRPFPTDVGRIMCKKIEFGSKRGCSLSHARANNQVVLQEISLCHLGARPVTRYMYSVHMGAESMPEVYPRVFTPPIMIVRSSLNDAKRRQVAQPELTHAKKPLDVHRTQRDHAYRGKGRHKFTFSSSCRLTKSTKYGTQRAQEVHSGRHHVSTDRSLIVAASASHSSGADVSDDTSLNRKRFRGTTMDDSEWYRFSGNNSDLTDCAVNHLTHALLMDRAYT
jgi:hypothetical protein